MGAMVPSNTARLTALIKQISTNLFRDKRVRVLWLTGSMATGRADAQSDVDLRIVVRTEDFATLASWWSELLEPVTQLVWKRFKSESSDEILLSAITMEYLRFDLVVQSLADTQPRMHDAARVVFDKDGIASQFVLTALSQRNPFARLTLIVEEFIRLLGMLPVVVARNDVPRGMEEQIGLHALLIDLLLLENGLDRIDTGKQHIIAFLNDEQKAVLLQVPSLAPNIEAIIQGRLAYARLFLPRARRLMQLRAQPYPEAFETTTRKHLWETLHVNF
jgi:hypothetical protein